LFADNKIGVKGGEAIGHSLQTNNTLRKLWLCSKIHQKIEIISNWLVVGTEIGADGANSIASGLSQNSSLTELNLSG
jgi:hypothetical protein